MTTAQPVPSGPHRAGGLSTFSAWIPPLVSAALAAVLTAGFVASTARPARPDVSGSRTAREAPALAPHGAEAEPGTEPADTTATDRLAARLEQVEAELRSLRNLDAQAAGSAGSASHAGQAFNSPGPAARMLDTILDAAAASDGGNSDPPIDSAEEEARKHRLRQLEAEFESYRWGNHDSAARAAPPAAPRETVTVVTATGDTFEANPRHAPAYQQMEDERRVYLEQLPAMPAETVLKLAWSKYDRVDRCGEALDKEGWTLALYACYKVYADILKHRPDVDLTPLRHYRFKLPVRGHNHDRNR